MKYIIRANRNLSWKQIFSFRQYATIVEYEILAFLQTKKQAFVDIFWFPILNPLLFGAGIGSFAPANHAVFGTNNYLTFILPGIIGLGFLRSFYQVVYRLTMDGRYGLQGLKMSTGVGVLAYILGNMSLPSIISIIQALISVSVLIILSVPITGTAHLLLMLGVGMISTWFWTSLAIVVSFTFKKYKQRDLFISLIMLPITLSSPAFYPLKNAPKYLQILSHFNPLTYNIVALREAFLYKHCSSSLLVIIFFTISFIMLSLNLIARKEFVHASD